MPQLDHTTFPSQLFWLVIFGVFFYVFFSARILPRMRSIFAHRSEANAANRREAEEAQRETKRLEQERKKLTKLTKEKVSLMIQETQAEFAAHKSKRTEDVEKQIDLIKTKAEKDLDETKNKIIASQKQEVESAASLISSAVL